MAVIYWVSLADHSKRCPKRGVCMSSAVFQAYICTVYTYAINIHRVNTGGTFFLVQIFVLCCDISFLVTEAYTLMIKMIKLVPFYLDALSVSEIVSLFLFIDDACFKGYGDHGLCFSTTVTHLGNNLVSHQY